MKQARLQLSAGLLLAAVALPLSSLTAQVTQSPPAGEVPPSVVSQPPATAPIAAPPPAVSTPAPSMEPVVNTAPSGNEPAPPREASERPAPKAERTATRTAPPRAKAAAPAPVAAAAAPDVAEPPAATESEETLTAAEEEAGFAPPASARAGSPGEIPVQVLPNEEPAPTTLDRIWPWMLGAGLAFAALALILYRRMRRASIHRRRHVVAPAPMFREETVEPAFAAAPEIPAETEFEPAMAQAEPEDAAAAPSFFHRKAGPAEAPPFELDETLAETPAAVEAPAEKAPADPIFAAAATDTCRPELELQMRPVRAGVNGRNAVVEFELTVDNHGDAPARDVRVSTWLFPASSAYATEMERVLIPPRAEETTLSEVDAGQARSIEATVALPTSRVHEESMLPVVAAEARWTLADGTEKRLFKQFAVGVPMQGELAHFDVEHPSGLHDNVEARLLEKMKG
jgi:hypothetical protein